LPRCVVDVIFKNTGVGKHEVRIVSKRGLRCPPLRPVVHEPATSAHPQLLYISAAGRSAALHERATFIQCDNVLGMMVGHLVAPVKVYKTSQIESLKALSYLWSDRSLLKAPEQMHSYRSEFYPVQATYQYIARAIVFVDFLNSGRICLVKICTNDNVKFYLLLRSISLHLPAQDSVRPVASSIRCNRSLAKPSDALRRAALSWQ
jgi:hypothetical protein